jgi:hypothetical protein
MKQAISTKRVNPGHYITHAFVRDQDGEQQLCEATIYRVYVAGRARWLLTYGTEGQSGNPDVFTTIDPHRIYLETYTREFRTKAKAVNAFAAYAEDWAAHALTMQAGREDGYAAARALDLDAAERVEHRRRCHRERQERHGVRIDFRVYADAHIDGQTIRAMDKRQHAMRRSYLRRK